MITVCAISLLANFNPRPREGSDAGGNILAILLTNFNPRPREGSDIDKLKKEGVNQISIHAPVKGATTCDWERINWFR